VKFSPNGKFVLAWTLDGCVRLWNYVEGRCIKTYQGHKNETYSLSGGFGTYNAPGGKPIAFAVSGSEDGDVVCWDVVNKKVLQKLEAHTDVVLGVDTYTTAEKKLIVSCGLDRTVRIWEEVYEKPEQEGEDHEDGEDDEHREDHWTPNADGNDDRSHAADSDKDSGVELEADVDGDGDTVMG
jgi:COMPASS component SWD3